MCCDFWGCPVQGQELDFDDLVSTFQLRMFYESFILKPLLGKPGFTERPVVISAFHVWCLLIILWAWLGSLAATKWGNGACRISQDLLCIRKERCRVFLGASGEVADLPFGVNTVAVAKMSFISAEGMSNVVPPLSYFSSSPEESSLFLLSREAIPAIFLQAEWWQCFRLPVLREFNIQHPWRPR